MKRAGLWFAILILVSCGGRSDREAPPGDQWVPDCEELELAPAGSGTAAAPHAPLTRAERSNFRTLIEITEKLRDVGNSEAERRIAELSWATHEARETFARELLPMAEREFGKASIQVAALIDLLVESARRQRCPDQEEQRLAEENVALRRTLKEPDLTAHSLKILGNARLVCRDTNAAESTYRASMEQLNSAPQPDTLAIVTLYQNLAAIYQRRSEYESCIEAATRAFDLIRRNPSPPSSKLAKIANTQALCLLDSGRYVEAARASDLALRNGSLGDPRTLGTSLNRLARLHLAIGDYDQAGKCYRRALEIDPASIANLQNLGMVELRRKNLTEARTLFDTYREAVLAINQPSRVAIADYGLATVQAMRGRLDGARDTLEKIVASFDENDLDRSRALRRLGDVAWLAGDVPAAESHYRTALEGLTRRVSVDHPSLLTTRERLSRFLLLTERVDLAAADAVDQLREARPALVARLEFLDETSALRYREHQGKALSVAIASALARPNAVWPVWNQLVRYRGLALDLLGIRARARGRGEALVEARQNACVPFAARLREKDRIRCERAEEALRAADPDFVRERRWLETGLSDALEGLPERAALIAYARHDNRLPLPRTEPRDGDPLPGYAAFVYFDGTADVHDLGRAVEIDEAVASWRTQVASGRRMSSASRNREIEDAYRDAGNALRRRIWDPISERVRGASMVYIVADGQIHLVDFAALPDANVFLLESGPRFAYLSAERDLVRPPSIENDGLLAVGDPAFDTLPPVDRDRDEIELRAANRLSACARPGPFRSSPGSQGSREVDSIETIWNGTRPGSAEILKGAAASEAEFRRRAEGKRVLHLATHGFVVNACDFRSERAAGEWGGGIEPENPFLLSGLALTGANRGDHAGDGILTALEVTATDLAGVELAVLSACETGLGQMVSGEGVVSLRRAFELAGVRDVVMSLWKVGDVSTREWMTEFYEARLERGLGTAESVRQAGLRRLAAARENGTAHPFFWAGFVAATGGG